MLSVSVVWIMWIRMLSREIRYHGKLFVTSERHIRVDTRAASTLATLSRSCISFNYLAYILNKVNCIRTEVHV